MTLKIPIKQTTSANRCCKCGNVAQVIWNPCGLDNFLFCLRCWYKELK
jgi:hypothetical protein